MLMLILIACARRGNHSDDAWHFDSNQNLMIPVASGITLCYAEIRPPVEMSIYDAAMKYQHKNSNDRFGGMVRLGSVGWAARNSIGC
jgi:aconitase A